MLGPGSPLLSSLMVLITDDSTVQTIVPLLSKDIKTWFFCALLELWVNWVNWDLVLNFGIKEKQAKVNDFKAYARLGVVTTELAELGSVDWLELQQLVCSLVTLGFRQCESFRCKKATSIQKTFCAYVNAHCCYLAFFYLFFSLVSILTDLDSKMKIQKLSKAWCIGSYH